MDKKTIKKIIIVNDLHKFIINSLGKSNDVVIHFDFYKEGCLSNELEYMNVPILKIIDIGSTHDGTFKLNGMKLDQILRNPELVFCVIPFLINERCIPEMSIDAISRVLCSDRFPSDIIVGIVYFTYGMRSENSTDQVVNMECITDDTFRIEIPSLISLKEASRKAVDELNSSVELYHFFGKDIKKSPVFFDIIRERFGIIDQFSPRKFWLIDNTNSILSALTKSFKIVLEKLTVSHGSHLGESTTSSSTRSDVLMGDHVFRQTTPPFVYPIQRDSTNRIQTDSGVWK